MSSTILILAEPLPLDRIRAWADAAGLGCTQDTPVTDKRRTVSFANERALVTWMSRAGSPKAILLVQGDDAAAVEASARSTFEIADLGALVDRVAAAISPADRIRAAFDLGVFCELVDREERTRVIEALGPLVADDDRAVRYAVAGLLGGVVDRRVEALLTAAAERHADIAPTRDWVHDACEMEDAGTLYDGPTDSWYELEQRAREGVAQGQWKRVVKASEDLLKEDSDHVQGLYFRGLAYEAAGDLPMALAYLGASRAEVAMEIRVHDESKAEDAEDEDQDDEAEDQDDEDEKAEEREMLADLDRRIEALRARQIPAERWASSREPLLARLESWWKEESTCAFGAASAIGSGGDLDVVFAFLRGAYDNDRAELERAFAIAPDAVAIELRLAQVIGREDKTESRAVYERILARLRSPIAAEPSPAAALVARIDKAPATLSGVLEALGSAAYEQGDRLRAMDLADELVKVDPDSIKGFQLRGHARLFEHRYAEAAEAYADAVREITRIREEGKRGGSIFFGDDPRPMLHFNRSCAFGRLGMKEEALEALRHAVRGNEKYAEDAKTEDWIECLWGTPDFEAITRQDARALVTKDELDAAFVARLVDRCKVLFYRGEREEALEAGERAILIAEIRGDAKEQVEALCALAYALAFSGSSGRAVELAAKAVVIAERVPLEARAQATATQAVVLHAHGDLEGAARAHLRALDLRREAHGADSPILAKSYGDMARLFADQGKPAADVRAMNERGVAVLAAFLERHEAHDDAWAEAITDRATLEVNIGQVFARESAWPDSLAALEAAATTFEVAIGGTNLSPGVLDNAKALADAIATTSNDDAVRARAVAERFEALRFPGPPAVRRERAFWATLRRFVTRMRTAGVSDDVIANALQKAARSAAELPDTLREVPELASFAGEIATRAARWPTFLAMSAMALGLAATDLDGSLENLEEICAGYALEGDD